MEGAPSAHEGENTVRRGLLVGGRVQGVGFRWWTRRNAQKLGLGGTVRNRPDGRVELHLEGAATKVRQMVELVHRGPPAARVDEVEKVESSGELPRDFRIVR